MEDNVYSRIFKKLLIDKKQKVVSCPGNAVLGMTSCVPRRMLVMFSLVTYLLKTKVNENTQVTITHLCNDTGRG